MKSFTDKFGKAWPVELRFKDIELIRSRLVDDHGNPLNLLDLADRGMLYQILTSTQRMIDIVFLCCLEEIRESFSEEEFDKSHHAESELIPDLKTDRVRKMAFWFGERLNGSAIEDMTEAFKEAVVDFTQNPHLRKALRTVLENQARLIESQAVRIRLESNRILEVTEQAMESRLQEELETLQPETLLQELEKTIPNPGQKS
ncbi:MAG: hypothetical protein Q4E67_01750 [Planctomycetia bacterium]|nr:hypothetical protein [Planctomycetia bacterium]MDO5113077.1 hypothetical protein [Planctomycetia bacterium]